MGHGHTLLINYLTKNNVDYDTIIEIGATRETCYSDQNSTEYIAKFANKNNKNFISVDMDPENIEKNNEMIKNLGLKYESHAMKGEDFLRNYNEPIEVIYLDAFDFYHNNHSDKRKERYNKVLDLEITNENCHKMHLDCAIEIANNCKIGTIVCFDDILDNKTFEGKGKTAIPYLIENGFQVEVFHSKSLLMKKIK